MPVLTNQPPYGLSLQPADDPAGNGQETLQVVFRDASGHVFTGGFYFQIHGGSKIRGYSAGAPHDSFSAFEPINAATDKMVVANYP